MRSKKQKRKIRLGLLLIGCSLCLGAWNLWEERRAARVSREALAALEEQRTEQETQQPQPQLPPDLVMPTVVVDGMEYIATVEIPKLELSLPIGSRWSEDALHQAPCRYQGSLYTGDLIVAGHNYRKHFGRLSHLCIGDEIYVTDMIGNRFAYLVSSVEELPGTAIEEMAAGDWELTLFTCTASGSHRVTIRCKQQGG